MLVGLVGVAAGQLTLMGLGPHAGLAHLLPGLLMVGAANGLLNAALGREAVSSVPPHRAAMGSGANNTARYVGAAVGITIVTVILTHAGSDPADVLSSWNLAVVITTALTLFGAMVVLIAGRRTLHRIN